MVIIQLDNLAGVLGQNPVGMPTVSLVNITIEVEWHWMSIFYQFINIRLLLQPFWGGMLGFLQGLLCPSTPPHRNVYSDTYD